jgi:hypothetical protein
MTCHDEMKENSEIMKAWDELRMLTVKQNDADARWYDDADECTTQITWTVWHNNNVNACDDNQIDCKRVLYYNYTLLLHVTIWMTIVYAHIQQNDSTNDND